MRRECRRGFTLLELTVGMVLTGLALSMGYGAYGVVVDRRETLEAALEADLQATAVRTTLTRWIQGIQRETQSGVPLLTGLDGVSEGLPSDELTVLTSVDERLAERTPVRIFIERDVDVPEHGLVAEWRAAGMTRTRKVVLAEDVAGVEIRYLSAVLGPRQWMPSWISSSVLPLGVEIRLLPQPGHALHPLLALPLRVDLEAGR